MSPEIPTFPPASRSSLPVFVQITLALAGGFGGALLLFWLFPQFRQAQIPPGSGSVIVQQPGQVIIQESTRLRELRDQVRPQVGALIKKGTGLTVGSRTLYPPGTALGAAVLLTADGWFATTAPVRVSLGDTLRVNGQTWTVERLVRDPASSLVLGQVTGSRFVPVQFADESGTFPGSVIFALAPDGRTVSTSLVSTHAVLDPQARAYSSDLLSFGYASSAMLPVPPGTPLYDLSGSLVGLTTTSDGTAILPGPAVAPFLTSTLQTFNTAARTSRPTLGVHYIFDQDANSTFGGAVLVPGRAGEPAIVPKGPAALAGLTSGDRITAVNGDKLTDEASLFWLLQSYAPGTTVRVTYQRNTQTAQANVTLGQLPSS